MIRRDRIDQNRNFKPIKCSSCQGDAEFDTDFHRPGSRIHVALCEYCEDKFVAMILGFSEGDRIKNDEYRESLRARMEAVIGPAIALADTIDMSVLDALKPDRATDITAKRNLFRQALAEARLQVKQEDEAACKVES